MPTKTTPSKTLEPGAVAGQTPNNALPAQSVAGPAAWGTLDSWIAPNFSSVQAVLLPTGTVLTRVFGYPDAADPYPSWETGSWWTRQKLPATEAEWRAQFAVEAQWNGGQCQVQWTTPAEIHAWAGPATAQGGEYADGEAAPGYYLPGGGEQIYIAPAMAPVGAWTPGPTPWQTPPPSATAASAAAKPPASTATAAEPVPTVAMLSTSVGALASTLQTMAGEAKAKGLDGGPLLFQAKQLGRIQTRMKAYDTSAKGAHLRATVRTLTGLARHIHTHYPWSTRSAAATSALRAVVTQAASLHAAGIGLTATPAKKSG